MKTICFSFLLCYALAATSQPVQNITIYPYDTAFATGYVKKGDTSFGGDMVTIGNNANKGFIIFDASQIPAGAQVTAATIIIRPAGSYTSVGSTGFLNITYIPVNTIYRRTTQNEIKTGEIYADLDWSATIIAPIAGEFKDAGIAALQKKIGTAFSVGLNPPTTTPNNRGVYGYSSANRPELRISYTSGNPSKPNADFTCGTRDTFPGSNVNFIDNSGNYPTSWFWEFGDDSTSTLRNPIHAYADTGYYTVKLTAKNAQGEDIVTKQNIIHISPIPPPPIAEFAVPLRNIAEEEVASFTDISAGYVTNWEWDFGDTESATEQNPDHTYAQKGVYSVRLIASSPFGSDTILKENFINVGGEIIEPVADFAFDNSNGLTVHFQDLCKNFPDEWAWNFGDSSTDAVQNPVHTYATQGAYTVCLEAINSAGTNKVCKQVFGTTTGVNNSASLPDDFLVYPNPFDELFSIRNLEQLSKNYMLNLYDNWGRLVFSEGLSSSTKTYNMKSFPKGLYFLCVRDGVKIIVKPLIHQ